MEQASIAAGQPPRKRLQGEVIVVVLLFAVPLLAWLVMQQGRVIDTQRLLIRQLNSDSQQLNAIRVRELQNRSKQAHPPATAPQADAQRQSGTEQSGAAPTHKDPKRRQKKQVSPLPPQEYPASRSVPIRKSA